MGWKIISSTLFAEGAGAAAGGVTVRGGKATSWRERKTHPGRLQILRPVGLGMTGEPYAQAVICRAVSSGER